MEIPYAIQQQIDTFQPVEYEGLTLHPIKVKRLGAFSACSHVLAFAQRRLPVALWSKPLLAAFYELDCQALANGEAPSGLFSATAAVLHMAVFPSEEYETVLRNGKLDILTDANDPTKLRGLRFTVDGKQIDLTPAKYAMVRQILAAQNGIKVPPDGANPELLDAEAESFAEGAKGLDISHNHIVTAVSALERVSEREIMEWPILRLDRHAEAHRRILDYILFGFAATQGAFRNSGNPVPHPWFPKTDTDSGALISASGYLGGAAKTAIDQQQRSDFS